MDSDTGYVAEVSLKVGDSSVPICIFCYIFCEGGKESLLLIKLEIKHLHFNPDIEVEKKKVNFVKNI